MSSSRLHLTTFLIKIKTIVFFLVDEIQEAFQLSSEDFKAKYSVSKPALEDDNITFHCRTGKRAQEAIQMLQAMGFTRYV